MALSNIGEAYNLSGDYIKALEYQQKALKLKLEIGDQKRLAITYTELGIIYKNVEDYSKALENLHLALNIAKEINYKALQSKIYKQLSAAYKNTGKFEKALENYQLFIDTKEELYSEENTRTIAELQAKYQVEKKDKENERLRHSEQLNKAQIKNQQLIIGFVLFILLGSFILSTIFHSRYQQNQKLNVQLSLKNKEVEEHQKNVEILNKDLKAANTAKDKFFSIVAHDLKNPFNSLLVLTDILIDDYDTFSETDRKKFIKQIKSSAENTYSLLQNLLEWASTQSGKTVIVKEKIDISRITEETVSLLKPIAHHKNINIIAEIPEKTIAFADKNMVSTIFLNLISNAVKFTSKEGEVKLYSVQNNGHIEIIVEDSGVGISAKNIKKLFRVDQKLQTEGTEKEKRDRSRLGALQRIC
ncbi:MAG: tetratricopeptide repeat-containing sensor histidine kinase [Bacteroidales bacterium]